MDATSIKKNPYEIMAIIRDAFKKRTTVNIRTQSGAHICQILKVDASGFHIPWDFPVPPKTEKISIELFDRAAKIAFKTERITLFASGYTRYIAIGYPDSIQIIQRRKHQRLIINTRENYRCVGRFNDGNKFQFKIQDVSLGGCALLTEDAEYAHALVGAPLRYAELDFGDFGTVTADLQVLNTIKVQHPGDDKPLQTWRLSCQFKRLAENMHQKLDEIIIKMLLEEKRQAGAERRPRQPARVALRTGR